MSTEQAGSSENKPSNDEIVNDTEQGQAAEQEQAAELPSEAEQLAALQEALEVSNDESLRVQAEMQNLRRRVERDVENARKFALEKFVNDLLPVVDNLERALAAMDDLEDSQKALSEGVELTLKSFIDVLGKFNVEAIDPKGESFNPDSHQAMTMVENADVAPNTVIDVFQKGYSLNGRLVRPAMVVVAKAPA